MTDSPPPRTPRLVVAIRVATCAAFLVFLALPTLDSLFGIDPTGDLQEKRRPARAPAAPRSAADLAAFPRAFENFFRDRFGFRRALIRQGHRISVFALGVSPDPSVVLGRDGWLFIRFGPERMGYYRGADPPAPERVAGHLRRLRLRRDWCESRGILYIPMLVPEKSTIYPERLPFPVSDRPTIADAVAEAAAEAKLGLLYPKRELIEAKADAPHPPYMKDDTHWNAYGAWIAYREIVRRAGKKFPGVEPLAFDRFAPAPTGEPGDLALKLGLGPYFRSEELNLVPASPVAEFVSKQPGATGWLVRHRIPNSRAPKLVVFHDSFGNRLRSALAEHFRETFFAGDLQFSSDLVLREKPDVVVEMFCERNWALNLPAGDDRLQKFGKTRDFEASDRVLATSADPASKLAPKAGTNTRVAKRASGWFLEGTGARLHVVLPALPCPPDREPIVRLNLDAPAGTEIEAFVAEKDAKTGKWREIGKDKLVLRGEEALLRTRPGGVPIHLRIAPPKKRPVTLREIEIRAAER